MVPMKRHRERYNIERSLEQKFGRSVGILLDLQAPSSALAILRVAASTLDVGRRFRLEAKHCMGTKERALLAASGSVRCA